ncbi:MAG: hypothetical protein R2794_03015 [Chitinophagales bacterium]
MNFGNTMNSTFADMNKMMDSEMNMDMSGMKMSAAEKAHCDSLMTMCNTIKAQMDAMKSTYNSDMETWHTETAAYQDWKKKAQEDKMADADFAAELANTWTPKLTEWNEKVAGWNEALTGMSAACTTTCDALMHAMPMDHM